MQKEDKEDQKKEKRGEHEQRRQDTDEDNIKILDLIFVTLGASNRVTHPLVMFWNRSGRPSQHPESSRHPSCSGKRE